MGAGVFDAVAGLVRKLAKIDLMGMRGLGQHTNIRPGTEHPRLCRRDDHRRHLWVLETQTLDGIIKLNIDTEIIGIELQLIARHQRRVFLDVHSQRGDPPLDAQFPVLVALWMRGEIDVEFPLGHQVISWRARRQYPILDLSQNTCKTVADSHRTVNARQGQGYPMRHACKGTAMTQVFPWPSDSA